MRNTTLLEPNHRLEGNAVDVWHVRFDHMPADELWSVLSPEEVSRARSLVSSGARRQFILGRAKLRQLLGRYCRVEPGALPIRHSKFGKPYLDSPFSEIAFSLSHSGNMALVAVSRSARIGVDLETCNRNRAINMCAAHWLHSSEQRDLRACAPAKRQAAFLGLWCRKEAVLKAEGSGLRFPLHQFRVTVGPGPAEILTWQEIRNPWKLYDLPIHHPYVAALALDRAATSIRHLESE